jgi:hypothetical protein
MEHVSMMIHWIRRLAVISLLIVCFASPAMATKYHIDLDCGTDGDGTTGDCGGSTGAWNSFSDITGISTSDDIYLKAGTTSSGSERIDVDWSGTFSDRAIIGCYWMDGATENYDCSGIALDQLPHIHGNNRTYPTSGYGLIRMTDWDSHSYITIEYLLITDSNNNSVFVDSDGTPEISHYVTIQNCVFEHNNGGIPMVGYNHIVQDNLIHNSPRQAAGAGFEFTAMFQGDSYSHSNIGRRNIIHQTRSECIGNYKGANNNEIYENVCVNNYDFNLYTANAAHSNKIHHNLIYHSNKTGGTHDGGDNQATLTDSTAIFPVGATGWLHEGTLTNVTDGSDCEVTANTTTTVTCTLTGGTENLWDDDDVYLWEEKDTVGIHYGQEGWGLVFGCEVCDTVTLTFCSDSNEYYNNLIANMRRGMVAYAEPSCTGIEDDFTDNKILNNTFVDNQSGQEEQRNIAIASRSGSSGNIFKNNISADFTGNIDEINDCSPTGWTFDGNLWTGTETGNCDDGAQEGTAPVLAKITDWDQLPVLGINGWDQFRQLLGSVGINNGVAVSGYDQRIAWADYYSSLDLDTDPPVVDETTNAPYGSGRDIGAFEYSLDLAPSGLSPSGDEQPTSGTVTISSRNNQTNQTDYAHFGTQWEIRSEGACFSGGSPAWNDDDVDGNKLSEGYSGLAINTSYTNCSRTCIDLDGDSAFDPSFECGPITQVSMNTGAQPPQTLDSNVSVGAVKNMEIQGTSKNMDME